LVGERWRYESSATAFFWLFLHDKQKNNAKHSLAAIETNTTSILFSLFIRHFFIESRNEKTRGCLWGFFSGNFCYCLLTYYYTRKAIYRAGKTPNPRCLFVFPFSFLIDDRLEKRFNDFLFKS